MKGLIKLIKSLTANQRPGEIGLAVAFAWLLALIPGGSALGILIFLITFFLRINSAALLLSLALFSLFAFTLDPLLHEAGYALLKWEPWVALVEGFHTSFLGSWFRLNNTLVSGGFLVGVVSFIPMVLLTIGLIKLFRFSLMPLLNKIGVVKAVLNLPIIKQIHGLYLKAQNVME